MQLQLSLQPEVWDRAIYPDRPCYAYQMRSWLAMADAVFGALFLGELWELLCKWARQAGKNDLDGRFTCWVMVVYHLLIDQLPQSLPLLEAIKTAPTYKPGISVSKRRLELSLNHVQRMFGLGRRGWETSEGYVYWLKAFYRVQYKFLSAQERANKRGETANLLLSMDECQGTSVEVYSSELAAMRATTGAPAFFWGTGGVEGSLIEAKQDELQALEDADGRRRVFIVDWEEVAEHNPRYGTFVQRERDRMGEDHPIFESEYRMRRLRSRGDFLSPADYDKIWASWPGQQTRRSGPARQAIRVGGLDFTGADEQPDEAALDPDHAEMRDNTCGLVGELSWESYRNELGEWEELLVVQVVAMLLLPGKPPEHLVNRVEDWFWRTWRCQAVAMDATGVGDGPSFTLEQRRGKASALRVHSTLESNSRMGYALQGLVKSSRFRWFRPDAEDPEVEEARKQFKYLQREITKDKKIKWSHPSKKVHVPQRSPSGIIIAANPETIHDDIPKAAGLLTEAAYRYMYSRRPPTAKREFQPWDEAASFPL